MENEVTFFKKKTTKFIIYSKKDEIFKTSLEIFKKVIHFM